MPLIVMRLPGRHAGRQQLSNVAECIARLAQVLQHLMCEYGFEGFRSEARLIDIPDLEGQVPSCLGFCQRSRRFDHARRWIDADRLGQEAAHHQEQLAELPGVVGLIDTERRVKRLREVLRQLPPKCCAAVVLQYRYELSYQEIADRLEVSPHMVKKYLAQALRHCRRRMVSLG